MTKYLWIAVGTALLGSAGAPAAEKAPVARLSAAQVVARNVDARGGLKAWRAVKNMTLAGKVEAGGTSNAELPFTMKLMRPHFSRVELRFKDQTAVQVFDGQHGWKVRPFLNRDEVEPFTVDEAKAAADWQDLDGPLVDYASKGTKIALQGVEPVEGHNAYKLMLTMKDGTQRHVWIDTGDFLERKIDGQPRKMDGRPRNVTIFYGDYRNEHGLKLPHTYETVVDGAKPHKMTIDHVAINEPMDAAMFAKANLVTAKGQGR